MRPARSRLDERSEQRRGTATPIDRQRRLLKADRGAASRASGELGGGRVTERPFHAIEIAAADDQHRDEDLRRR